MDDETKTTESTAEHPHCCEQPCEFTGGYKMKDGRYVCWLHAIQNHNYYNQTVGKLLALVPTSQIKP